jgi:V/A-type H+/Na+-transporting ATPase subunit D
MSRLALSKTQLEREKANLAMYRRYLPSLDLKRQQLTAERNKTQARLAEIEEEIKRRVDGIGAAIPMLADKNIDLKGLVALKAVKLGERSIVGQRLPNLEHIEVEVARYGYMARPHWVDLVAQRCKEVLQLQVEAGVTRRQAALLDDATTKITQRVILLGDIERSAVVNSKIAKRNRRDTTI